MWRSCSGRDPRAASMAWMWDGLACADLCVSLRLRIDYSTVAIYTHRSIAGEHVISPPHPLELVKSGARWDVREETCAAIRATERWSPSEVRIVGVSASEKRVRVENDSSPAGLSTKMSNIKLTVRKVGFEPFSLKRMTIHVLNSNLF